MTFSPATLALFAHMLTQMQFTVGADELEQLAATVTTARRELAEAQAELAT